MHASILVGRNRLAVLVSEPKLPLSLLKMYCILLYIYLLALILNERNRILHTLLHSLSPDTRWEQSKPMRCTWINLKNSLSTTNHPLGSKKHTVIQQRIQRSAAEQRRREQFLLAQSIEICKERRDFRIAALGLRSIGHVCSDEMVHDVKI